MLQSHAAIMTHRILTLTFQGVRNPQGGSFKRKPVDILTDEVIEKKMQCVHIYNSKQVISSALDQFGFFKIKYRAGCNKINRGTMEDSKSILDFYVVFTSVTNCLRNLVPSCYVFPAKVAVTSEAGLFRG